MPNQNFIQKTDQKGFTLVEFMIALAIAAFLLASSIQVMLQAAKMNRVAQLEMELQSSASIAKLFIERDIKNAGFLAGIKDISTVSGSAEVATFKASCEKGGEALSRTLAPKVFALNANAKAFYCIEKHISGSDALVLHYAEARDQVSTKKSEQDKLYLKVSLNEARLFKAKDVDHFKNNIASEGFSYYELKTFIYYLRETGRSTDGHPVYGLYREYNGNDGFLKAEEIIAGVEQLQFQYFVNGEMKNANELMLEEWQQVSLVSVSILLRALYPEHSGLPAAKEKALNIADIKFTPANQNLFVRKRFDFDIALRN